MKSILVTGGAGYIGSHTVVELVAAGFRPVIVDDLSNSDYASLDRLEKIIGRKLTFYEQNYRGTAKLSEVIKHESIDGVIHFAGFKMVGESVTEPLKYYQNNVAGFVDLLETLLVQHVSHVIFSSSAAVYGQTPPGKITEDVGCQPESPYGWSKRMDEIILHDTCAANPDLYGTALRYFNVVGSHESAIIGESPRNQPQSLLPIIVQAVANNQPLTVYGDDYDTLDGTCLRDYIHVVDLARAHVAALQKSFATAAGGYHVYNIGTSQPTSVMELIRAFEKTNGVKVPYKIGGRRTGDIVISYASADKANRELSWHAEKTIEDAVRDAWRWHQINKL